MESLAHAIQTAFANRDWTPEERQAMEDVLDAAAEWRAGRLPLKEAARFGEIADRSGVTCTAARTQYRAMLATPLEDPRRPALRALLDTLVARQPGVVLTSKGVFDRDEIYARGVTVNDARDPWDAPLPNNVLSFPGGAK